MLLWKLNTVSLVHRFHPLTKTKWSGELSLIFAASVTQEYFVTHTLKKCRLRNLSLFTRPLHVGGCMRLDYSEVHPCRNWVSNFRYKSWSCKSQCKIWSEFRIDWRLTSLKFSSSAWPVHFRATVTILNFPVMYEYVSKVPGHVSVRF